MTEKTGVDQGRSNSGQSRPPTAVLADRRHRQMALRQTAPFWLVAGVLVLSLFAATAPSPLYRVYQDQLRFSVLTLTAIFAVYSIAVLAALLVFGSVSDYVGRRPVIVVALALNMGGCVLFLEAHSVGLLVAARLLQGASVGAGIGALGAAMIDLQPSGSSLASVATSAGNFVGQGMGALCTSLLAQYGPVPTELIWWLLLGGFAVAIAGIIAMPEPGGRRRGALASLRPRVGVPPQARCRVPAGYTVPHCGVGPVRLLLLTGTVAGREGHRVIKPGVGRSGDLPARRRGCGCGRCSCGRGRARRHGYVGRLPHPVRRRGHDLRRDHGRYRARLPGRHRGGRHRLRAGVLGRLRDGDCARPAR